MINIYDQNTDSFDNNGLATLNPISAELSVDINGAWALNMTLPYDTDGKYLYVEKSSIIQCDVSILREQTSGKQLFRVYDVKKNLSSISVVAFPIGMEAIYDAPIEELNIPGEAGVATASGIDAAGVLHNYVRDHGNDKYTISSNVTTQSYSQWKNTNLIAAISGSDDASFVNKWGGEVVYDNFAIVIRNRIGQNNNPCRVAYGRNLTGLEHDTDMSGVITRVYPLSKDDLRLNTYPDTEYPSGQTYIDSSQTGNPYTRSAFITSPYELTDTKSDSNSITAINTRGWQAAIYTTILNTAETLWNGILDDIETYCADYIKDITDEIIEYTQARYVYTHKGWQSIIKALIKSGIEWIGKTAIADMSWIGVNGYIYGDFDSDGNFKNYPKGQYLYCYSESKWYYFEDDGLMSEDEIPQETIDLLNTYDWHTNSTGTYYGDTEPRMFSCWIENSDQTHSWVNSQGYYEAQWDDADPWDWTNIDGWRYGRSATQYVKSCYVEIDKNLEYFGADGFWRDWMRVPAEDMGWYQTKEGANAGKWWYGSLNRYYAHNEFVYVTVDGTMEEWWYDKEGWYDADSSGESDFGWHGDESTGIWFGEEDAGTGDKNKYIHDKWAYIDGTYYWFDSDGYISGDASKAKQDWAWGDQVDEVTGKHWFGNTDESFNRMWLASQYIKIDNEWYFFDSDGYMIDRDTKKSQTISWFSTEIVTALNPVADLMLKAAYDLLYTQMTTWVQKQFEDGLDKPQITVSVNLVDLSKTSEYAEYADLERIYLGDSVRCVDTVHGMSIDARVVGLTYDLIRGYNTKVTIGQLARNLSQILSVSYQGSGKDTGVDNIIAGDGVKKDGNVISTTGTPGTSYGIQDVIFEGASLVSGNVAVLDEVGAKHREVWQSEFNDLPESKNSDGVIYFIRDGSINPHDYISSITATFGNEELTDTNDIYMTMTTSATGEVDE